MAIWTLPSRDCDFSGRWNRIKAHVTHRLVAAGVPVKRHRNGEYALWQRRFWEHTIRNEIDFERHIDYVHFNPVKHRLVSRAREWPYWSFHVYVRRGLLPANGAGDVNEPRIDFGERRGWPRISLRSIRATCSLRAFLRRLKGRHEEIRT